MKVEDKAKAFAAAVAMLEGVQQMSSESIINGTLACVAIYLRRSAITKDDVIARIEELFEFTQVLEG